MSEIKVNKISPRTNCGTVQLGDSGDTITIPAGATITNNGTQTGFGREGSVNWQTGSIKTTTFTAANGEGYFVDTSSGAVTANLPAGSAGAIVSFADYTRTFNTNSLTISPNGSEKIGGVAADLRLDVNGQAITLVYVDGTEGWINVQNAEDTETGSTFITATGGTESIVCTNFKVHTFTGPGTFCVSQTASSPDNNLVDYLVIAGGGGGGGQEHGSGGGAGGYRESPGSTTCYSASPLGASPAAAIPVSVQGYPIAVGGGGAGKNVVPGYAAGDQGSTSSGLGISSAGGGGGASGPQAGGDGGSGGGGSNNNTQFGSGNTPSVTPPQGNNGGVSGYGSPHYGMGGGGGAGATGSTGSTSAGGAGGAGVTSSINATPTQRAGGGGGSSYNGGTAGAGGAGGGGTGTRGNNANGTAGTANTGGGGGGGERCVPSNGGKNGGSGIVIIRYKFQ
mgnify:CR=1 FL=1